MGLSASQARLLTITARKSDCEYESMRLSHQKIALSRDMNKISAEYDSAMSQTKLIYDFYGNNSEQTALTYGLLMKPSPLNNFTPSPFTDNSGRIVLDDRLAKAARDAGIPQEGLDGLPSSDVRDTFISSLGASGYMSQHQADNILLTTYNQAVGLGSGEMINVNTRTGTLQDLIDSVANEFSDFSEVLRFRNDFVGGDGNNKGVEFLEHKTNGGYSDAPSKLSFADILRGDYILKAETPNLKNGKQSYNNLTVDGGVTDVLCNLSVWECMFEVFEEKLNTGDAYTQAALNYARRMIDNMVTNLGAGQDNGGCDGIGTVGPKKGDYSELGKNIHDNFGEWIEFRNAYDSKIKKKFDSEIPADTIGLVGLYNHDDDGHDNSSCYSIASINVSNVFRAYLTYFAQYMEGISDSSYEVTNKASTSNLIDDMFNFDIVTSVDVSGDALLESAFYDALFNQICTKGWVENNNVNDQEYLQESLKNGSIYVSTLADDGYYYQGNYATNTYIKEITDEEGIAQAEAKYNREKAKLEHKENILDMKMKNLDTEISALSTEYDTVKNVISKNIEKSFKRYNA